ncbi:hypothetical protein LSAT2_003403, partial [Lamellibrachia satsuma]
GSKCFTVLDANMGYFQIELTEESQALTAFNTPFGRYKYRRLPMGISVAPEIYQRAMSELLAGLAGVEVIMDDILIHAPTTEMHNTRLQQVLQRCRDRNLKLNPLVERLAKLFSMHGIPEKLLSDNGPQFSSHHFAQFATEWNFKHITTSPTMHQANGMVERANQTVRRMIEKMRGDKVQMYAGLLNLRNTSRTAEAGSPAQRLMGRRTATKLPTSDQLLQPK